MASQLGVDWLLEKSGCDNPKRRRGRCENKLYRCLPVAPARRNFGLSIPKIVASPNELRVIAGAIEYIYLCLAPIVT